MRSKKSIRRKRELKRSYLLIVDGESEIVYLKSLKSSNIFIEPTIPKKKSFDSIYNFFKKSIESKKYDEIFWIVDLDVVVKEKKLDSLIEYRKKYENRRDISILINNPCLEFWFCLHYELKNFKNSCKDVISYLKRKDEFKSYSKKGKDIESISKRLLSRLDIAIKNAKSRGCSLERDNLLSCSMMHILFEKNILSKI
jgi:hypothetical protein